MGRVALMQDDRIRPKTDLSRNRGHWLCNCHICSFRCRCRGLGYFFTWLQDRENRWICGIRHALHFSSCIATKVLGSQAEKIVKPEALTGQLRSSKLALHSRRCRVCYSFSPTQGDSRL
jgi:hypothetical protein